MIEKEQTKNNNIQNGTKRSIVIKIQLRSIAFICIIPVYNKSYLEEDDTGVQYSPIKDYLVHVICILIQFSHSDYLIHSKRVPIQCSNNVNS